MSTPNEKGISTFWINKEWKVKMTGNCLASVKKDSPRMTETLGVDFWQSPVGLMLLAVSDRGLAALLLGEEEGELKKELASEFPGARITKDTAATAPALHAVRLLLGRSAEPFDLPVDLRGTGFQRAVWKALQEIPRGEVASYAEVARRIGHPRATRAVASACAANRIAVVIPCHRVVRSDGGISGYRWGAKRKSLLIGNEGQ